MTILNTWLRGLVPYQTIFRNIIKTKFNFIVSIHVYSTIVFASIFALAVWSSRAEAGPFWTTTGSAGYPTDCGENNYTGGSGKAACVSSASFGTSAAFFSLLISPEIIVSNPASVSSVTVQFLANYQDVIGGGDGFDFGPSTDGGFTVAVVGVNWDEDHGAFRSTPGESVNTDITVFTTSGPFVLSWVYFDNSPSVLDWYAQVDDVVVELTRNSGQVENLLSEGFDDGIPSDWQVISAEFPVTEPTTLALLGLGLAGLGFARRRKNSV
jgi:hypothetical protein